MRHAEGLEVLVVVGGRREHDTVAVAWPPDEPPVLDVRCAAELPNFRQRSVVSRHREERQVPRTAAGVAAIPAATCWHVARYRVVRRTVDRPGVHFVEQ